jgi:hypothetical protein
MQHDAGQSSVIGMNLISPQPRLRFINEIFR